MKKKIITVTIIMLALIIGLIATYYVGKNRAQSSDSGAGNKYNVKHVSDVQPPSGGAVQELPTEDSPASIIVSTTWVEIPFKVPHNKGFRTWTTSGKNYRVKDKSWSEEELYINNSSVKSQEPIVDPVVSLTDVEPGSTARIYYCVVDPK